MRDTLHLRPNLHIELLDPDGTVIEERWVHNQVCTAGKNRILTASSGALLSDYAWICIGTGATAELASDTALQAELVRASGALTNPTPAQWQAQHTFPAGVGTGDITEFGLDYDSLATGAILARKVDSPLSKTSDKSLRVTWVID